MVVVLPAPFGPRTAVTWPASAVSVSPSTAVTGPYRFTMPEISTAGVLSTHAVYWPPLISGPIGSDIL